MFFRSLIDWFAGGDRGYMTLVHCMSHDYLWIGITVALDLVVALGYVLIALHWRRNESGLRDSPAKAALGTMKNIFLFCGLCGYVFIPVKLFWPAWRLYDGFLAILAYFTWRYAWNTRELQVVYNELGRSDQLAQDLQASREEVRRRSFFLNAVSHDLKTPLNGLMLQAELAEHHLDSGDTAALRESLDDIRLCVRTTADLLNNFLELGRLDCAQDSILESEFRLADLIAEVAGALRPRAESKGLILTAECPADVYVRSDRSKVRRVVENLLDNGVKYTREGFVRLSVEGSSSGLLVHVTDAGDGIAAADQRRIFDDFVQVNNRERDSRKGFGLGLAIARRLAAQIGGRLTLESELGRGSRFTLHLPVAVVRDGALAEARTPSVNGPSQSPSY